MGGVMDPESKTVDVPTLTAEEVVVLVSHLPDRHHAVAAKLMKLYAWLVANGTSNPR